MSKLRRRSISACVRSRLSEHIEIDRAAAEVWAVVADYRRDPEWRTDVVTMAPEPADLVAVGTTTAEELRRRAPGGRPPSLPTWAVS